MRWATPRWWYRRRGSWKWAERLLWPLAHLWESATAKRMVGTSSVNLGIPVICVGNLTAGGSGKTPVAMEITRLAAAMGLRASIVASGYGGKDRGPTLVDPLKHRSQDVGDEPLLMSRDYPVFIARNRVLGAQLALSQEAELIVLDDGHQNASLKKTLSIVVVDGETRDGEWPFGSGRVIPAGPLREPLAVGLARANLVVLLLPFGEIAPDPDLVAMLGAKSIWLGRWVAELPPPAGRRLGFAGIAKPWRVERALRTAGCNLVGFKALPDHAELGSDLMERLARKAESLGAGLVTTEKDWVRLPDAWRDRVACWPIRVRFADEDKVRAVLDALLPR